MNIKLSDFMALQACVLTAPQRRAQISHRRLRSVPLGPAMRFQFEDELTVRHQIAQMLRAECITDPAAMQHEIDTYTHLVPDGTQWTATLLIELPDAAQRARELPRLSEAAHEIYVECERQGRVFAQANEDLSDRHLSRPSAVHFLRFQLPEGTRTRLLDDAGCFIGCTHSQYHWRRLIPPNTLRLLRADLTRAVKLAERDEPRTKRPIPHLA